MRTFKPNQFKTIPSDTFLTILLEFGLKIDIVGGKKSQFIFQY